jgi:hypothetical protein
VRACLVAAVVLVTSGAHAQLRLSLTPQLSLGAGYDDNLFLDANPAGPMATQLRADAIIDIRPALAARLVTRDHALALSADYLERVTPHNGDLRDVLLRLDWASRAWHRLRLLTSAFYEHYEATQFPEDTFNLGGGDAALRLIFTSLYLQAGYRADARAYSDPVRMGQVDVEQRAYASLHARLHRVLATELDYSYLHLTSKDAPAAELDRHLAEASLILHPWTALSASVTYGFQAQSLPDGAPQPPGGPRHDLAHRVLALVSVRPARWLELFARYDLIYSTSDQPTGRYHRNQVLAGIGLSWELSRERLPPPPPLRPTVNGHEVTFRARAVAGASVAVIGDWNGWTPLPLEHRDNDLYEATYTLPPGRHAWSLRINDVIVTPPEAEAYTDDGFGGRNAIVEVP